MEEIETGRSGLSRRDLIKRAAVVGGVAWTAPVIVESLTRAAFAASPSGPCKPYWVKLYTNGATADFCPASGPGRDCDGNGISFSFPLADPPGSQNEPYCANTMTACCTGGNDKTVTVSLVGGYRQVVLPTGCYFTPLTGGVLGGRYDSGGYTRFVSTCAGGSAAGNGRYVDGGTTGWVKDSVNFGSGPGTISLSYIYVQFCCG